MRRAEIASHGAAVVLIAAGLVIATLETRHDGAWAKRPVATAQSSGADDEDDETPVPLPVRRPDPARAAAAAAATAAKPAAPSEPPPPADWPDAEKIEALRRCVALLAPLKVRVGEPRSVRQDRCGGPALVEVQAFEIDGGEVALRPALLVNCESAARLHDFIARDLQPLAKELLGAPVVRIENVGGYQCRGVVGSPSTRGLSEHAYANAIDMGMFVTADGRRISVREDWGAAARDKVARSAKAAKNPGEDDEFDAGPPPPPVRNPHRVTSETQTDRRGRRIRIASEAPPPFAVTPEPPATKAAGDEPAARTFLRRLHAAGCRRFSTALGPEANEAHRDHFHFDLAVRRGRSYCE